MFYHTEEDREVIRANRRPRSDSRNRLDQPMLNRRLANAAVDDDDDEEEDVQDTLMMAGPSPMVPRRPQPPEQSSSGGGGGGGRRPGGGRLSFHLPGEERPDVHSHLRSPGLMSSTTDASDATLKGRSGPHASFVGDPAFLKHAENDSGSPGKGAPQLPTVDEATAELMDKDLEAITKQLTERETMHACDVMERLLDQEYEGFSEDLFVACNDYLNHARKYDTANGTSIASFIEDAADLEHNRDVKQELAQYDTLPWQRKAKIFLEYADSGRWSRVFYFFLSTVVVLACVFTVLETIPEWNPIVRPEFDTLWRVSDWTFTIFLTGETGLRFYVNVVDTRFGSRGQNAIDFLKRPGNIADIVALLPTYIQPFMTDRGRVLTGSLRTARLLRLMKFLRRYQPIRRLVVALTRSVAGLIAPFCFLAMSLLFFASTVYYAERGSYDSAIGEYTLQDPLCLSEPRSFLNGSAAGVCPYRDSRFVSMGQSMWWGIVSMAAVGYGDFVPITTWGKFVGSVTMVAGVVFVAMPIAVIGANYTQVIETTQAVRNQSVEDRVMQQDGSGGDADGGGSRQAARKLTMPGEALINAMGRYLADKLVDLRAPSPEVLFVVDALLEATVKELVDAQRVAAREPPLFSAGGQAAGVGVGNESPASAGKPTPQNPSLNPSTTGAARPPAAQPSASAHDGTQVTGRRPLSLWTATVTADVPVNMPPSVLADVMRTSSANALSASVRNITPRARRRGASMAEAATRRITLAETTLSRPVVALLGCSHAVDDAILSTFSMPAAGVTGKRGSGGQHTIRQVDSVEGRTAAASRNHSLHDLHDYADDLLCSVRGSPHSHFVPLYSRALHEQVGRSIAQSVTTRAAHLDQLRTANIGKPAATHRHGGNSNASAQERVYVPELAVSQRHATLALTRAWGEYVPLLYPLPGSRVYTVTGDLEHSQGTLTEVKVADARQIRANARAHLLDLAQRKADAILRKHKGTSAFAVRQREQAQEELRASMRWESGEARFTFQHELLHHWVEMEQRPAALAPGTVLQFGSAVDVGAPEYGDADDIPEQRVAGGPASSGRQFALRFKFADNSVASPEAVALQQAAEKGTRPRFDSRMSLGGQSVMSVDETGAAATIALSSRGKPVEASFDGSGGDRFGSPRSRSASVRGPASSGGRPGLVQPSPGSTGARLAAAAAAAGGGGQSQPPQLRRDRNGVPQFEL